jgi:hypothetical protein
VFYKNKKLPLKGAFVKFINKAENICWFSPKDNVWSFIISVKTEIYVFIISFRNSVTEKLRCFYYISFWNIAGCDLIIKPVSMDFNLKLN